MPERNLEIHLKYKIWLETQDHVSLLGEGKWQLLKAIKQTGSLQAAVKEVGYSYRQTWENLKRIEEKLGFKLIEKSRGGEKGGKTMLTPKGERIVAFFDKLYERIEPEMQNQFDQMMKEINDLAD